MKYHCMKGHVHSTQKQADACYICKKKAKRKSRQRRIDASH